MEILLAIESAVSRSPQLSNERLLNFFSERQPQEAKGQAPLFSAPGIGSTITVGEGPHRGSWLFNGLSYYVSGTGLYSVDTFGNVVLCGMGILGKNPVGMSDNGKQLCIVNGVNGWIYTATNGLVQITSYAFYPAYTVTFMDGYFIFDRAGTNEWFLSALYDGTTYNGLDFASAEGRPGFLIGTAQNLQLLFLFCSQHIEIWYDAGAEAFPFQRYAGGILNYGCVSPYTICEQDGALFFLGADKVFYRLQANVPIRVSTHPIETIIEQDGSIETAFCLAWTWEGHKMVALTFPNSGKTVCYDISTGRWHDRNSVDANFNDLGTWRPGSVLSAYDQVYFGDRLSGNLGILDWGTYTEYGNPMVGEILSIHIHKERLRTFVGRLELDVEAGVGAVTGQGSDPQIMLSRSLDGGRTWTQPTENRSMGKIGEYTKRMRWMNQGQGRQMQFKLRVTDPVPRTIIAAAGDISFGMP